ncbi:MAG: anaerobic glycerol-3-phosphate dehydrogenase subunit C [Planctomycetales bacterium]|nr:anaerobic glycerol-3-phosphate dehydrogenase subunit C [Planctomycetales bacterium]
MDVERQRIEEDLRGQIAGDVRCDDLAVQLYSSDASIYEIAPLGVVRPRTVEDVVATVGYAAEHQISLHARGGGSGLAGGALGSGLIIDFSRYMRRILEISDETVRVQPGVVLANLNRRLASQDRLFGPDPANSQVTTLGSMISVDASGSRWPAYGSVGEQVESLQVVLANGELARFSLHHVPTSDSSERVASLTAGVDRILQKHEAALNRQQPRNLIDGCGYQLAELRQSQQVNMARLFAGSEGTLGLITEATLRTTSLPAHVGSVLLYFESLGNAAHAANELAALRPSACDLMDRRHLSLARESDPRFELMIPQAAEAVLLVEHMAQTESHLNGQLAETVALLQEKTKLASGSTTASDRYDHQMLWQLARHYVPTLYRLKGATRPIPFVEDIAVPPKMLPEFLVRLQQTLKQERITASLYGHVGHGRLHIRPFLDLANEGDVRKMESLAAQLYADVWEAGGTISSGHGDGLSRTPYVAQQTGQLAAAHSELKALFDPEQVLNPGKIVPQRAMRVTDNLRRVSYPLLDTLALNTSETPAAADPGKPLVQLQLDWQPEEMAYAARACNGCASCRTQDEELRMCPIFRFSPREESSPRAKANLARGILTGALPGGLVVEEACKQVADLCVHCHMCRLECPSNVDIPKLMIEAKAAYTATNGERIHDWLIARVDMLCRTATRFSRVVNWGVANRPSRWIVEKLLGIAQGRKLPRLNHRPFLQQAAQRRLDRLQRRTAEKVLYFVDTYANYCDSQLADALLAVLEHNEIAVYVPPGQQQAGMPLISRGVLDLARHVAEQNVALLAEAVRQGYTIVATEPSAVLALRHEYPMLLPEDDDAQLVAEHTFEACHYLWRRHQRGQLQLDFATLSMRVGYHIPCHMKALEVGTPGENLLGLIPGLHIERLDKGCSGMAGIYGLQHRNYRNSLRAGLPLLTAVRTGSFKIGATECSACKIQMEQGSTKPTIHPIKLLALAYGLMPELKTLLHSPGEDLVVT